MEEQDEEWATTINVEELFKDDMDASSGGVEDWQLFIQCLRQRCNLCNTLCFAWEQESWRVSNSRARPCRFSV